MHESPDLDVAWLMQPQTKHWTEEAGCAHDDRFTAKYEWLTIRDLSEMTDICLNCPVFAECYKWAINNEVVDVFAAGWWWTTNHHAEPRKLRVGYGSPVGRGAPDI